MNLINENYRIIEKIGEGGMSRVYKAEHVRLKSIWAVKEVIKNQDIKFDFLSEANILKKLKHPMLPQIVDIFENDEYLYVVEEYIEGESLDKVLKREKSIDENIALRWFKEIAECLHYLHSQKPNPIIYRDMKPANIMLQPNGKLRLIDFGIAREYKKGSSTDTTYIGTKGYAAPEQFGQAQSDARTDIYSLGVTMYHIITGKSPYDPPYKFVPARQINPRCSIGCEKVLEKCIQQEPEDRYSSTTELIFALDHIYLYDLDYKKYKNGNKKRKIIIGSGLIFSIIMLSIGLFFNYQAKNTYFEIILKQAHELLVDDPIKSLEKIDEAMNIDSNNQELYTLKAEALFNTEQYQECIDFISEEVMNLNSFDDNPFIIQYLANSYKMIENNDRALELYNTLFDELGYIDNSYLVNYAELLSQNGEFDKAYLVIDEAEKAGLANEMVYHIKGTLNFFQNKFSLAEEYLKKGYLISNDEEIKESILYTLVLNYESSFVLGDSNQEYAIDDPLTKEIAFLEEQIYTYDQEDNWVLWSFLGDAYYKKALSENNDRNYFIKAGDAKSHVINLGVSDVGVYKDAFISYFEVRELQKASEILDKYESAFPYDYEPNVYRAFLEAAIQDNISVQNRDYYRVFEEYGKASSKLTDDVDITLYSQLEQLVYQLEQHGWKE